MKNGVVSEHEMVKKKAPITGASIRKKNSSNILIKVLYLQVVEIYAIDTDRTWNRSTNQRQTYKK